MLVEHSCAGRPFLSARPSRKGLSVAPTGPRLIVGTREPSSSACFGAGLRSGLSNGRVTTAAYASAWSLPSRKSGSTLARADCLASGVPLRTSADPPSIEICTSSATDKAVATAMSATLINLSRCRASAPRLSRGRFDRRQLERLREFAQIAGCLANVVVALRPSLGRSWQVLSADFRQ